MTYRDEISVEYACELFNQIRLFKKPIYCNPSKDNANKSSSFNQSTRSDTSGNPPPSPTPSNSSLIEGILNRTNSLPLTSTPFNGKRKFGDDGSDRRMPPPDSDGRGDSRVVLLNDDRDRSGRYNDRDDRGDRHNRYGNDRDRSRYDDSNRSRSQGDNYNNSRDNSRDRYDDSRSNSRYERSNSFGGGNMSPMHMQALNQSHGNQYNRHNSSSSPRDNSNFGPTRQNDSRNNNNRRQRSQPY